MFQNASNDELKSINIQLMKPANIDVARVECVVSAVDMETIIADLAVSQTLISGVITNVPYGDDRKFELFCYDSDSILTYYGSSIANIYAQNPVIEIVLNSSDPLADVTIIGHFADNQATEEKVVFVSDWDGFKNIYIMDTNGMNVRQLTFTENYKYHPRLSPDRSTVAFDGNEGDGMKLFFLDLATNQIDTLAFDGLEPVSPSWHPDGKSILFHAHYPYKKDIYKYNLMTDELTCLLANDTRNWAPVFSPH